MYSFGVRKGTMTTGTGKKMKVYHVLVDGKRVGYSKTKKGAEAKKRREMASYEKMMMKKKK